MPGQESQGDSDVDLQQPALVVKQERWVRVAEQEEVLEERPHVFQIDEREIVLWKYNEHLHAFDHRCPHTGGGFIAGTTHGWRVRGTVLVLDWTMEFPAMGQRKQGSIFIAFG